MSTIGVSRRSGWPVFLDWVREAGARRLPAQGREPSIGIPACFGEVGPGRAGELLAQALRENWNHEQDWLWLSTMVTDEGARRYCLERALYINPQSEEAGEELARLARRDNGRRPSRP